MAKFAIQKAAFDNNNGDFNEMPIKGSELWDKTAKLSSKKKGLNFFDEDGSLFCYAKLSAAAAKHIQAGTLSVEQLLAYGNISASEFEGETYYFLTIPEALRGGTALGKVADLAKSAKKLVEPAKLSLADISKMIEI